MRLDKPSALLQSTLINIKRLVILYMAMFVENKQWIQLQCFITLNFVSFTYVLVV